MDIYEILAPSGRESQMGEYIKKKAEEMGYACRFDTFGNLICGEGDTAIECGMDTLCLMKTAETDSGMIKVAVPNSGAVKSLKGKRVRFLNGVTGVIRCEGDKAVEDFDLAADIGVANRESAKNAVPTGEFATVLCDKFETEDFIFGNGVSDYVLIEIMLEVMKRAKDTAAFIFTASKKLGGRGIKALLGGYDAKNLISLVKTEEKGEVKCRKGAGVVIKEKGTVPSVDLRQALIKSAEGDAQLVATEERLYLDLAQICGKGAKVGGVCVPVRDKDGIYEGVSKSDTESTVKLLTNYLKQVK